MFVRAGANGNMTAHKLVTTTDPPTWEPASLKSSVLKDFSTFSIPKLGYRTFKGAMTGKELLGYISHIRSTRRGFRPGFLVADIHDTFSVLSDYGDDEWQGLDAATKTLHAVKPNFFTVKEALHKLMNNDALGVALNPDTAIVLEMQEMQDDPWTIYYKGTRVGRVSEEGNIRINNKVMNRDTFRRQLKVD